MHKQYTFNMSVITNTQLLETIDITVDWANELSERWLGTTIGKVIDNKVIRLASAVKNNNLERAYEIVHDLAQTLEFAEKE